MLGVNAQALEGAGAGVGAGAGGVGGVGGVGGAGVGLAGGAAQSVSNSCSGTIHCPDTRCTTCVGSSRSSTMKPAV